MQEEIKIYEEKMHKSYDALINEYSTIRAGRANPKVLDKLRVDYYGTPTPIQQVANISVPEPRMLQIQPWEKSLIKAIEKAILTSDLGINPNNDGSVILSLIHISGSSIFLVNCLRGLLRMGNI